jgi:excisionase family DNA binding protein/PAS domain S-box-containing protein
MEKRDKLVLTVKDVAAYLQVNQTTIYRLLRQSAIPAFKLGGDWRFNVESIDAWRLDAEARSSGRRKSAGLNEDEGSDSLGALGRLRQAISEMVAPIGEMHAMIPIIKRIAEAIEDRRDASGEIAQLYQGQAVAFRPHWDKLVELAPIPFAVVDRECRAVSFNDAYCQMLGVSPKQLRTAVLTDFVCETDRELAVKLHRQLLNGGAHSNSFAGRLTAEGAPVLIRSLAWAVRPSPSAPAEFAADILERAATKGETSEMFARCAEDLSKHREKVLRGTKRG